MIFFLPFQCVAKNINSVSLNVLNLTTHKIQRERERIYHKDSFCFGLIVELSFYEIQMEKNPMP